MRKWIDDLLQNEQLILDIKSGLVLLVSIGLPLIYFLYSENFSVDGLLNFSFGILSLVVIIGNIMTFLETSDKAMRDEIDVNEDIQKAEKDTIEKQLTLPKQIDPLIEFNKYYNEQKQDNRNKQKTNKRISTLTNKITHAKIKGKKYSKYEQEIKMLETSPLFDKSYKPVELKHIISQNNKTDNQIEGNDAIHINPKTYGMRGFLFKQVFKSLGIGGSGLFILGISENGWTILTFYLIYIIALAILIVFRYPNVRKVMRTLYIDTLKNKQTYIEEFHVWNKKEKLNEESK